MVPDKQMKNMLRTEHKTATKRKWYPHVKRKKEEKIKTFGGTFSYLE